MKILSMGSKLFDVDGRTDRQKEVGQWSSSGIFCTSKNINL